MTTTTLPFAIGTRVHLIADVEIFPTGIFKTGLTGTVAEYGDDGALCYVKLDEHYPDLDEWDNCLEITDWNRMNNDEGDVRIIDQIEAVQS